ncbi:MAG: hypothetical protein HY904_15870 [Deltaproteobacteria bacterium]|nr:hypothetical protein [Deltaproteobacteria bacterium]
MAPCLSVTFLAVLLLAGCGQQARLTFCNDADCVVSYSVERDHPLPGQRDPNVAPATCGTRDLAEGEQKITAADPGGCTLGQDTCTFTVEAAQRYDVTLCRNAAGLRYLKCDQRADSETPPTPRCP